MIFILKGGLQIKSVVDLSLYNIIAINNTSTGFGVISI